jgi:hypothetical protein
MVEQKNGASQQLGWRDWIAENLNRVHLSIATVAFVVAITLLIIRLPSLPPHSVLAYAMFATLCLHQLEEYGWPGGFLWGLNSLHGSDLPDRFPGNRLAAFLVPVITTLAGGYWLFCHASPIATATFAIFALLEVVAHTVFGAVMLSRFRSRGKTSLYFPGNATAWFLFAPFGVAAFQMLIAGGLMSGQDWGLAIGIVFFAVLVPVLAATHLMANRNTRFWSRGMPVEGYFGRFLDHDQ